MGLKYMCNACGMKYESRVDAALCHPDIVLVYDNAAEQNAHLTPETQPQSQAVVNASTLEQSDGDTPPAQAQVA